MTDNKLLSPWDIERKRFLCSVTEASPVASVDLKVRMQGLPPLRVEDGTDERGNPRFAERHRFKAVQFSLRSTLFSDEKDMEGRPIPGVINHLSKEELKDLEKEIERRVVRWRGKATESRGVGPERRYADGKVLCTHNFEGVPNPHYLPHRGDEKLSKYISLRLIHDDEFAREDMSSVQAGWKLFFEEEDTTPQESGKSLRQEELEQEVAKLKAKIKALEDEALAQADEAEFEGKRRRRQKKG